MAGSAWGITQIPPTKTVTPERLAQPKIDPIAVGVTMTCTDFAMTFAAPLFPDLTPKTVHIRPHRVALLGTSCAIVGSPTPQPSRPTPQPPRTGRSTQTPHAAGRRLRKTASRTPCSARSSTSHQHSSPRHNRRFHASWWQHDEPEAAERACEEWPAHESPIGRKQNVKGGFHFDTPRDLALITQAADRAVKESPMTARDQQSKSLLKWLFER